MIFNSIYQKGYEAGVNAQKCSDHEDQNRRLEDMLKYGKEIGRTEGWEEGYRKGYACGYSEGELDAKVEHGIIEFDGIEEVKENEK